LDCAVVAAGAEGGCQKCQFKGIIQVRFRYPQGPLKKVLLLKIRTVFQVRDVALGPGEEGTVEMLVYTPRHYTTAAGEYTFIIEATSLGSLGSPEPKFDDISGIVNILPFYDLAVRRTSHFETGVITITSQETDVVDFQLQNLGNVEETFWLIISSDFDVDCFSYPERVTLTPGGTVTVQVEITPPFTYSTYYEAILIGSSNENPLIQDEGGIIIRVLPTCDSIIYLLSNLRDELDNIPDDDWRNPSSPLKKAMDNKLNALINIMSGCSSVYYEEAYEKLLHDNKPKLTGNKTDEEEVPWAT